jgi:hypothetical protein
VARRGYPEFYPPVVPAEFEERVTAAEC